jgi:carboxymethylenebutenolidase
MEGRIEDLYRDYLAKTIDRRDFLKKLTIMTGGVAAADSLLSLLEQNHAYAEMVPQDDARLLAESIVFPGASGEMEGYLVRPKGDEKLPGVVVVHENRGLNAHIADVARRVALEGFLALAPDALSPLGGTPEDPDKARDMIGTLDPKATVDNFVAAVKYLAANPMSTGKVGVVGFCWGGAMSNQLAVHSPELTAAVPYYGRQPALEDVPKIKVPLLLHYAGDDEGINKGIAAYEEALKKAGVEYKVYMYEGAKHAFNNDTNAERYNEAAAKPAWERTIKFFKEKLK